MNERVHEVLVDVARQPTARWRELLRQQFPDDEATMRQGLLWLHANADAECTIDGTVTTVFIEEEEPGVFSFS